MPLCSFFSFLSFFFFFRRDQKETERDGDLWELDTTPEVIDRLIYWTSRVSPLPVFFNLFLSRSEKKFWWIENDIYFLLSTDGITFFRNFLEFKFENSFENFFLWISHKRILSIIFWESIYSYTLNCRGPNIVAIVPCIYLRIYNILEATQSYIRNEKHHVHTRIDRNRGFGIGSRNWFIKWQ